MYLLLLKFTVPKLNDVIISKTKVLLPQVTLADFDYSVFLLPNISKLFGFQIFWLWAYMIKVIPETRRAH